MRIYQTLIFLKIAKFQKMKDKKLEVSFCKKDCILEIIIRSNRIIVICSLYFVNNKLKCLDN